MATDTLVQRGPAAAEEKVREFLDATARTGAYDTLGVAVAFASVPGVRAMIDIANALRLVTSFWLFGLDDCLTHPSAIVLASALPGAAVRVAGERLNGVRFHPKVYWFASRRAGAPQAMVVGSANLTLRGLERSVESVAALRSGRGQSAARLEETWQRVWELGTPIDASILDAYQADFAAAQRLRPRPKRSAREILADDAATIDPTTATVCWIEVGKITGFRSEQLEIKAEQALFFGLAAGGGPEVELTVSLRSGSRVEIPAKYRSNAMWRFNLPITIPEVERGLRPGGARSPYAAVFSRRGGVLELRFLRVTSREFEQMRAQSLRAGTLGQTTARQYGWY